MIFIFCNVNDQAEQESIVILIGKKLPFEVLIKCCNYMHESGLK